MATSAMDINPQMHMLDYIAMMAANEATCRFSFQALPEFFFDYFGAAKHDSAFRATTLPAFGLIDRHYDSSNRCDSKTLHVNTQKPWQRFQAYIEHLNDQGPDFTTYKVLYITRHGLGYHNVYETKVGRDAWNVGNFTFLLPPHPLTVARTTGRTWTEMASLFGPTPS